MPDSRGAKLYIEVSIQRLCLDSAVGRSIGDMIKGNTNQISKGCEQRVGMTEAVGE